jgi:hypothetical protein
MNAKNCRLSTNKEKPVQQQVGARFVSAERYMRCKDCSRVRGYLCVPRT